MKTVTVQSILLNAAAAILPIARDIEQQIEPEPTADSASV